MSSSSGDARLRARNESTPTRADRMVTMHPDGMGWCGRILNHSRSFTVLSRANRAPQPECLLQQAFTSPAALFRWPRAIARTQLSRPCAHRNWAKHGLRIFLRCGLFQAKDPMRC
jgi:hypothetical protein